MTARLALVLAVLAGCTITPADAAMAEYPHEMWCPSIPPANQA